MANRSFLDLIEKRLNDATTDKMFITSNKVFTNLEVNQIIQRMLTQILSYGDIVAIHCKKPINKAISMLYCICNGATFVPIDTDAPQNKIEQILKDSSVDFILTDCEIDTSLETIEMSNYVTGAETNSFSKLYVKAGMSSYAYYIYTSGTTGKPKGVKISYSNLSNYFNWLLNTFNLTKQDNTIILTSLNYDLSFTSFFGSLLSGGSIFLLDDTISYSDIKDLNQIITENDITYIKSTPSLLTYIDENSSIFDSSPLKMVFSGGERISKPLTNKMVSNGIEVVNHYGPTETTVGIVYKRINKENIDSFLSVPVLGSFIDNIEYIIKGGKRGELLVHGKSVFDGYVNDKDNEDIFTFIDSKKYYHTGDIVEKHENEIMFIGRTDSQVKLNGNRIELATIENKVMDLENISEAFVVLKDNPKPHIVCYLKHTVKDIKLHSIKNVLSKTLSRFEIPTKFLEIISYERNNNGKVVRSSIVGNEIIDKKDFIEKTILNHIELPSIISKILKYSIDEKSYAVSFFDLGVTSLDMMRIIAEVDKFYNVMLTTSEIISNDSILLLDNYLAKKLDPRDIYALVSKTYPLDYDISNSLISVSKKCSDSDAFSHISNHYGYQYLPDIVTGINVNKTVSDFEKDIIAELIVKNTEVNQEYMLDNTIINIASPFIKLKMKSGYKNENYIYEKTIFSSYKFKTVNQKSAVSAVQNLFRSQSIFNTMISVDKDNNHQYYFIEHKVFDYHVSVYNAETIESHFDLSRTIKDTMYKNISWDYSMKEPKLYFNFLLVRHNEYNYELFLLVDHFISDKEIIRICTNYFNNRLRPKTISYTNYVKRFKDVKSIEVITNHKPFIRYIDEVERFYDNNNYLRRESFIFGDPFSIRKPISSPYVIGEVALHVYEKVMNIFNMNLLPIRVFYNKRWFTNRDYKDTIGDLSDSVPILISGEDTVKSLYEQFLSNVNYLDQKMQTFKNYKSFSKIYENYYLSPFSINFLGNLSQQEDDKIMLSLSNFLLIPYSIMAYTVDFKSVRVIFNNGVPRND